MIYGHDKTFHGTQHLQIETRHGKVVAVWFRCCMIPFEQVFVGGDRVTEMQEANERAKTFKLNAVDIDVSGTPVPPEPISEYERIIRERVFDDNNENDFLDCRYYMPEGLESIKHLLHVIDELRGNLRAS